MTKGLALLGCFFILGNAIPAFAGSANDIQKTNAGPVYNASITSEIAGLPQANTEESLEDLDSGTPKKIVAARSRNVARSPDNRKNAN